jgi:hypothetical protein
MRRYMIERDIPGIGAMSPTDLGGPARASNKAIEQIGSDVQWQHSYVAADKTYCVYLAKDEAAIHKHAKLSGIPLSSITALVRIIDPMTAEA